MVDRTKAPQRHSLDHFQLASPLKDILSNGIPIFFLPNETLDLIHICVRIKTGILYEKIKHLSSFTYGLLKDSSTHFNANEVADFFDFYGVHYDSSISLDNTCIYLSVPKNNVGKVMPEIYHFLAHPQFRDEDLSILKNLKIKDLEYNSQKTDVQSTRIMLHAMFGDNIPAGVFSTRENINAITTEQMQEFHQRTFCAENIALFLTGNLNDQEYQEITDIFAQTPHGTASGQLPHIAMPTDKRSQIIHEMPGVQSSITLCMPTIGYTHEDYLDFSILSTITGGYFGSRLMQNLRERNGYTYGVSCGFSCFGEQSLFIINSDVNKEHTQDALNACFDELKRLQDEPIGAEELENVKSYLIGDQIRDLDTSVSILKRYIYWYKFGLDERIFQQILNHIHNITAERVQRLAHQYFQHNNFTQIIVGELR